MNACGKVILAGEHAAVYGYRAVAVGLDRGASAETRPAAARARVLRITDGHRNQTAFTEGDNHDVARAFTALLRVSEVGAVDVDVETALPASGGLGSSAAMGVAIVRALDPNANEGIVLQRAMHWERVFHGNPSGLDTLVAARGGGIAFERGRAAAPVPLPPQGWLAVGNSGEPSSTRLMVQSVAQLRARRTKAVDAAFATIGSIADDMANALRCGDLRRVGSLMSKNHLLLRSLAVSTPGIERMCGVANATGALGAKITGAGGGGCVVALADTRSGAEGVMRAWEVRGFRSFVSPLAGTIAA